MFLPLGAVWYFGQALVQKSFDERNFGVQREVLMIPKKKLTSGVCFCFQTIFSIFTKTLAAQSAFVNHVLRCAFATVLLGAATDEIRRIKQKK